MESTYWTVNAAGAPPPDQVDPTVMVTNPASGATLSAGNLMVTAQGDDDQALDKIELYIDGTLVNTTYMPDWYPYPEATYNWTIPTALSNETHVIVARAYDKAGNIASHSISVNINPIPGFTTTLVFVGCFLAVAVAYLLRLKEKPTLYF